MRVLVGVAGFEPATPSSRTSKSDGETAENRAFLPRLGGDLPLSFRANTRIAGRSARIARFRSPVVRKAAPSLSPMRSVKVPGKRDRMGREGCRDA